MHDVGDGAMGLWKALREVFPAARHQRCWVHKARNVTNALPKSAQPGATKAMQEIYNAEDRAHAAKAIEAFARTYGGKWPKAVANWSSPPRPAGARSPGPSSSPSSARERGSRTAS